MMLKEAPKRQPVEFQPGQIVEAPLSRQFELSVPFTGFFDVEQFVKEKRGEERSEDDVRQYLDSISNPVILPDVLLKKANQTVAQLTPETLPVAMYLGGKGRVLGTRLIKQMARSSAKPLEILEQGQDGAVNLGGVIIEKLAGYHEFTNGDESIGPEGLQAVSRHVHSETITDTDPMLSGLKSYFRQQASAAVRAARQQGRQSVDYMLIDDQRSSGLTNALAVNLMTEAVNFVEKTDPDIALPVTIHSVTDLAPNWDHVPGHFIRDVVKKELSVGVLLDTLGLVNTRLADISSSIGVVRGVRQLLTSYGIPDAEARAVSRWAINCQSKVSSYVMRGGYTHSDELGQPLLVQQKAPGDILRFRFDHLGRPMPEITVDAARAVKEYNQELDNVILGDAQ